MILSSECDSVQPRRFGFRMPDGGFFLWLDVGDGEKAAVELWRQAGVKVLPGAYMGADTAGDNTAGDNTAGDNTAGDNLEGSNPGRAFIRVALVHETAEVEAALQRLADIL